MFDGRWRASADRALAPVGASLRRTGVAADHLTAAGLALAVLATVAVASGELALAGVLLVVSSLPDLLDGAVAKASGTASSRGAFFDSVADRISDSLILGGVAWHLASGRHPHLAVLALAVVVVSTLVSYERAKAESLGFTARGGLMERAERVALLTFGLVVSALLVPVLWLMLVLTAFTATQRFVRVWREASQPASAPEEPVRWRSWRSSMLREHRDGELGRWRTRRPRHARAESWRRRIRTRP